MSARFVTWNVTSVSSGPLTENPTGFVVHGSPATMLHPDHPAATVATTIAAIAAMRRLRERRALGVTLPYLSSRSVGAAGAAGTVRATSGSGFSEDDMAPVSQGCAAGGNGCPSPTG